MTTTSRPARRWSSVALTIGLASAATLAALTVTAMTAPADTGAACAAAYTVAWQTPSDNPPDFGVTVTVTNNAPYAISGWTVAWRYTVGQTIIAGSPYSATVVQSGTTVTATPQAGYNANLAAGASTTFGFHATYNGTSNPLPTVTCSGPSQGSSSAVLSGPLDPLGANTAAWDGNFVDPAIGTDLSSANVGLIRYPGGSWADQYLWQTNSVNGSTQSVDFSRFSQQVDAINGGQKFVTVNYGSDTPQSAGAWVAQSRSTAGQGVTLWEIGNEEYGSWETDNHSNPHTAASYASNALPYLQHIKAADPNAQTCYDYGMDPNLAPGSGVDGWQTWNSTILQADAANLNCADVHWYPINGTPTESDQSIMELIDNVPTAAQEVRSTLSAYDPSAYFVVGESNMSQTANAWNEQPIGALFSAADALEWLSYGAQSVDWWDVHNYGSPTADFGMFSSASSGEPAMDTPYPPYYGYLLASKLAVRGATVGILPVATPNIYGYYSKLPNGSYGVLLANADPTNGYPVNAADLGISGQATEYVYDKANPTIASSTFAGGTLTVPAESVVVLTAGGGTPPTTTTTPVSTTTTTTTTPTTPTTTPTTSTTSSTSSGPGLCQATWSVVNQWSGGFQLGVTVTNTGTTATGGWTVGYAWPGSQTISQIWNATATQTGTSVTATNLGYNGSLAPSGSTTFGLIGNGGVPGSLGDLTCSAH